MMMAKELIIEAIENAKLDWNTQVPYDPVYSKISIQYEWVKNKDSNMFDPRFYTCILKHIEKIKIEKFLDD